MNNAIFNVCMETYSVGHCNCIAGERSPKAKYACVEDSKNDDEDSDCMILTRTPPKTADLTVKIVHSDEHFLKQQIKPAFISSYIHILTTPFCLLSLVALKVCVCCPGCDGGAGLGSGGGLCFLASRHCPISGREARSRVEDGVVVRTEHVLYGESDVSGKTLQVVTIIINA